MFREWHRHRTGKLNEMSGRYTELPEEFYVPSLDRIQGQHKTNKQMSGVVLGLDIQKDAQEAIHDSCVYSFKTYHRLLNLGVAREVARVVLPVNTYSQMVWQMDLSNLLGFLKLRMDTKAQWEIRQYANAIADVVKAAFPATWGTFESHVLRSFSLSDEELPLIHNMLERTLMSLTDGEQALLKRINER